MKQLLTFAMLVMMTASCSTEIFDTDETSNMHLLKLNTNVADNVALVYPIDIYTFDAQGTEQVHLSVNSLDEPVEFTLPTGSYTIMAVSGSMDFSKGYSTEPLIIGKTTCLLDKSGATANLTMKYAVARLSVTLADVSADASDVKVRVDSLYGSIDINGNLGQGRNVELSCKKKNSYWVTDTVYVLPSVADKVSLTIIHSTDKTTSKNYSYVYPNAIKAGYPYNFHGSYMSGVNYAKLSFSLDFEDWGEEVNHDFAFGDGADKKEEITPSDASVFYVDELPEACSVWNGHVVTTIDEEGNALLLSLKEWSEVSSNDDDAIAPWECMDIAVQYIESGMSGWQVPTLEELQQINKLIRPKNNDGFKFNDILKSLEGNLLKYDASTYYIISDKINKYCFYKNTCITKTGLYPLRLVKPIKFILKTS